MIDPAVTNLPPHLDHVTVDDHGCWLWGGYVLPNGYGTVYWWGKKRLVHRLSYEALVGPIPEGLVIDHLCRTRRCLNPSHMEPVTRGENVLRGVGPTAMLARQTHCKNGHPLAGANLYMARNGRNCRICRASARRAFRERTGR